MLQLENLRKSYPQPGGGRTLILDVPSFAMAAGEHVVLVGESGSGKTTLLHSIAGLIRPDEGRVVLDGLEMTALSEAARDRLRAAKLGYVFQTFNLLAGFTALENVRLGMTFGRGRYDANRARELLVRVGLEERLHYRPGQLSIGQQQRVAVARALANRPRLLLADEPTANVDRANQQRIIDLIRDVCAAETVGLLLVTHSEAVSQQFDRVVRLDSLNRAVAIAGGADA